MKNKKSIQELETKRVLFIDNAVRELFFMKLRREFGSWENLRNKFNIYRSRLEKFRGGSISIPNTLFGNFLNYFDMNDKRYFLDKIELKDSNWGRVKGGQVTSKKYPKIFDRGREKGLKKITIPKYDFDINQKLSIELCEFLGAFIGDGFTNKYNSYYIINFSGHSTLDLDYYNSVIIPHSKVCFGGLTPSIRKTENILRVNFYSKLLFQMLTRRFRLPSGKKCYTVKIPDEVLNSNQEFLLATLKGIFDTDGCIFFDKRKAYRSYYPRINLTLANPPLIKQICSILNDQNIDSGITNNRVIQINGFENVSSFLTKIGFSNNRHLKRIIKYAPKLLDTN